MGVVTGTFLYPNGSPVASGLFQWKLSSDAIQSTTANCIAPPLILGNLDPTGHMTATFVFNDDLFTTFGANTTYQLTVKDLHGGQVWNESYYLTGSAINLNLYPPAGNPSGPTIASTPLLLETNGTKNGSQQILNLIAGTGTTITDGGTGGVTIASTGGVVPAGATVADLPASTMSNNGAGLNTDAVTYSYLVTASGILNTPLRWKVGINVGTGPISFQNWVVARTLPGSLTVVDYTPITFGATSNPTLATGLHMSDAITLQIDTAHDYWFMAYSVHQSAVFMLSVGGQYGPNSQGGVISGGTGKTSPYFNDYTDGAAGSPNTIVPPNTAFGLWLSPWQAA
jgi:hypothetical protein